MTSLSLVATPSDCRFCGGPLDSFLSLGKLALSGFPLPEDPPARRAPLDLSSCRVCRTVQLAHTVRPDLLFREYWYRSGVNETMVAELQDVAKEAAAKVGRLSALDVVLDVGANDGTFLAAFDQTEALRVAYEPAFNLFTALRPHCDILQSDYFPNGLDQHPGLVGRVKILTAIACFYAVQDPHGFVDAVARLLHPTGVWIVQFQDLHQMLQAAAFDNICHEHLFYPSLAAIQRLIREHQLVVTDAEVRAINGGSLRLTIQHEGQPVSPRVEALCFAERYCESWQTVERFAWRVDQMREQILGTIESLTDQGYVVDLYGASTKANTLLQYLSLGPEAIRQAWERTPEKIGRTTITGIPIVSEETGRADPPTSLLVGIWQFRAAVLKREAEYLRDGSGSLLFPLPQCEVVMQARGVA